MKPEKYFFFFSIQPSFKKSQTMISFSFPAGWVCKAEAQIILIEVKGKSREADCFMLAKLYWVLEY